MSNVSTLPRSRPLTRRDLDAVPDDGQRYELSDGTLIVSPAPTPRHQRMVLELAVRLRESCPDHLEVLVAPLDVVLADDTVLQPDVLVAERAKLDERGLAGAPMLAVEVLSLSTRRVDLVLKRSRYEAAGCPSYWVLDPQGPALVAWDLTSGAYVEVADVTGTQTWSASRPFSVQVQPSRLVAP